MRWTHVRRGAAYHYDNKTVTLLSTPLYSNTTLVVFIPNSQLWRYGGSDAQIRRLELPGTRPSASGHPHDTGAGAIPATDGTPGI